MNSLITLCTLISGERVSDFLVKSNGTQHPFLSPPSPPFASRAVDLDTGTHGFLIC